MNVIGCCQINAMYTPRDQLVSSLPQNTTPSNYGSVSTKGAYESSMI